MLDDQFRLTLNREILFKSAFMSCTWHTGGITRLTIIFSLISLAERSHTSSNDFVRSAPVDKCGYEALRSLAL